jgi:hypothetical protein
MQTKPAILLERLPTENNFAYFYINHNQLVHKETKALSIGLLLD